MFHCLLYGVFFIKILYIFFNISVDKPGHGKDVLDGFNAIQKQYLATCLRIHSTSLKFFFDSNRIRVDAKTKKGEVSFSGKRKSILDIRDKISTKGDNKHVKRKSNSRLKHKYYWLH